MSSRLSSDEKGDRLNLNDAQGISCQGKSIRTLGSPKFDKISLEIAGQLNDAEKLSKTYSGFDKTNWDEELKKIEERNQQEEAEAYAWANEMVALMNAVEPMTEEKKKEHDKLINDRKQELENYMSKCGRHQGRGMHKDSDD